MEKMGQHDVYLDTEARAGVFISAVKLNNLREDDKQTGILDHLSVRRCVTVSHP